ncbi:hypothetical protein GCM10022226_01050 [Sphaerisporangium flaviroseum]|uniref:Uncharacterized protein n=1 Tax=Sphaerisporangium flaviroseum TaxID=509199 RepID=A0ABP7HAH0_9ACTN
MWMAWASASDMITAAQAPPWVNTSEAIMATKSTTFTSNRPAPDAAGRQKSLTDVPNITRR